METGMCTCIKSLSGIVFRALLICLASLASLGGTATAAVDASAERVSGVSVQRDFSSRVQALTEHAPGEHFSGVALGAWDNSARIAAVLGECGRRCGGGLARGFNSVCRLRWLLPGGRGRGRGKSTARAHGLAF